MTTPTTTPPATVTAFRGSTRLAQGSLEDVARTAFETVTHDIASDARGEHASPERAVLIFDDRTGRVIDLEMRGGERAMMVSLKLRGLLAPTPPSTSPETSEGSVSRGRGRPKLGVVPREVTLLPRHWEWLATQPGGASVALRKLVDAARKAHSDRDHVRARREATYAAMSALAGDRPHFEDASRALFRGDRDGLITSMAEWPIDIAAYVLHLLDHAPDTAD